MLQVCLSASSNQKTASISLNMYIVGTSEDTWAWIIDHGAFKSGVLTSGNLIDRIGAIENRIFRLQVSKERGKGVILNPQFTCLGILSVGEKQITRHELRIS